MSMRITVHVIPNARTERIERQEADVYRVHISAPATEGKANKRLIEALASYFGVAKSCVEIEKGAGTRIKRVQIHSAP